MLCARALSSEGAADRGTAVPNNGSVHCKRNGNATAHRVDSTRQPGLCEQWCGNFDFLVFVTSIAPSERFLCVRGSLEGCWHSFAPQSMAAAASHVAARGPAPLCSRSAPGLCRHSHSQLTAGATRRTGHARPAACPQVLRNEGLSFSMSEDGPAPGTGPPLHADRPSSEPHPVKQRIEMVVRQFSTPATVDPQVSGIASTSESLASWPDHAPACSCTRRKHRSNPHPQHLPCT